MVKDSFLDTNVIFSYSNYTAQSSEIIKKCYKFIANKQGKFIICGAVLEELPEIIIKRRRIHKIIVDKLRDSGCPLEDNPLLSKRDVPFAKQLYEQFKNSEAEWASKQLANEADLSELAIQKFSETLIDERVIPFEQIQAELVNKIHDILSNHADCRILASAIQLQETRDVFSFVTSDRTDFAPNQYNYLKEHFEINYPKEKHVFPELLNLMFTN